ncbi:MAG: hypothetical protein WKG07_23310 [Hymenobacter sp.]
MLRPGLQVPGKIYFKQTAPRRQRQGRARRTMPAPAGRPHCCPAWNCPTPTSPLDDWLEDTLLTVPYEVDGRQFETGQLANCARLPAGRRGRCCPSRPCYFDYFTPGRPGRAPARLELDPACVRVRLRHPRGAASSFDAVSMSAPTTLPRAPRAWASCSRLTWACPFSLHQGAGCAAATTTSTR